jgi:AcrR family transcriptional regulator
MQRTERTDRSAAGPPTQAREEEIPKRERILRAAAEVFASQGFESSRMQEVARLAGVSKGTLYNFFDSKEDLLIESVIQALDDSAQRVRMVVDEEGEEPMRRLGTVLRMLLLDVLPDQMSALHSLRNQVWGVVARDPAARERVFAHLRDFYRQREAELERTVFFGSARGSFRSSLDPAEVGLLLMALFDGLIQRAAFDPTRIEPERALEVLLKLLNGGLFTSGRSQ